MTVFSLDSFISLTSSWEYLKKSALPIFIYGMGDGAIKIIKVLDEQNIKYDGIFASDEFVRGHSFLGHKVKKLSEIEQEHSDFIIVLAFACGYKSLIDKIELISKKHKVIVPDVPVAGDGLFDKNFLTKHFDKIEKTYNLLSDNFSKKVYQNIIAFKITGDLKWLENISSESYECYDELIKPNSEEIFVDLGAYRGDTIEEFINHTNNKYRKIIAFEPNKRNYKKLNKYSLDLKNIETYNTIAWNEKSILNFSNSSGRQAMISSKGIETDANSVDNVLDKKIATFIKYDVEGAEHQAILGSKYTIENYSPKLKIALYHRNEDIFELPLLINSINSDYSFYIRKFPYIPAWEINLFCIPNN